MAIVKTLYEMAIGNTTVINGKSVTRRNKDSFEVGTWGKSNLAIREAIQHILAL